MSQHLFILTGASRGMGLAMATKLLKPGNTLLCISRKTSDALVYIKTEPSAKACLFRWGIAPFVNETWLHTIHSKPYITIPVLYPAPSIVFK